MQRFAYSSVLDYEAPALTSLGYEWDELTNSISFSFENNTSMNVDEGVSILRLYDEDGRVIDWTYLYGDKDYAAVGQEITISRHIFSGIRAAGLSVNLEYDLRTRVTESVGSRSLSKIKSSNSIRDPDQINAKYHQLKQQQHSADFEAFRDK